MARDHSCPRNGAEDVVSGQETAADAARLMTMAHGREEVAQSLLGFCGNTAGLVST